MPCNCRKCDCSDRKNCYVIEARLNAMACVFDAVAGGLIGSSDTTAFVGFQSVNNIVCQGGISSLAETYVLTSATSTSIFSTINNTAPLNFLPTTGSLSAGALFLSGVACIPTQNGACLTCGSHQAKIATICSMQSSGAVTENDLSAFAALAQNLRYAAGILGCQNE